MNTSITNKSNSYVVYQANLYSTLTNSRARARAHTHTHTHTHTHYPLPPRPLSRIHPQLSHTLSLSVRVCLSSPAVPKARISHTIMQPLELAVAHSSRSRIWPQVRFISNISHTVTVSSPHTVINRPSIAKPPWANGYQ